MGMYMYELKVLFCNNDHIRLTGNFKSFLIFIKELIVILTASLPVPICTYNFPRFSPYCLETFTYPHFIGHDTYVYDFVCQLN